MRAAFFVLLLTNVTFLAWSHWVATGASRGGVSAPSEVPQLRLAPVPRDVAGTPVTQCLSLGPFTEDAATAAAGVLSAAGFQPRERLVDAEVADGYWVYVPGLRDAVARRRALATLQGAGVRDAAVVTAPDQPERVSAGIFTEQARAESRAAQVRSAGLDAVVEAREHHLNEHWLDFQVSDGRTAPSLGDFEVGPAAQLKVERCATGG